MRKKCSLFQSKPSDPSITEEISSKIKLMTKDIRHRMDDTIMQYNKIHDFSKFDPKTQPRIKSGWV